MPGLDVELLGADAFPDLPDIPETESSFAGNALLKAREIAGSPACRPSPMTRACASMR